MHLAVLVAALGYFVDTFDMLLFSMVRVASLTDLGLSGDDLVSTGAFLLNMQLIGSLIGGLVFGIFGDKKGRVSVLFASILIYSLATFLNAFVTSIEQYALLRLIAGFGIAGELGAGVTLVSELLSKEKRGYGTTIVASFGMMGVVTAGIGTQYLHWKTCYLIGGGLGLMLLLLRMGVHESGMFSRIEEKSNVRKGDLVLLFSTWKRVRRFCAAVFVACPTWFVVSVLATFSPEIGIAIGIQEKISAGKVFTYLYTGLFVGDIASGLLSQWLKSRKKAIGVFLIGTGVSSICYLLFPKTEAQLLSWAFIIGVFCGYWAVFITAAAEQFGTNLRATVATMAPNIVRGSAVLMTLGFTFLKKSQGPVEAAIIVGVIVFFVGLVSILFSEETFGKDLDFVEE